MSLCVGTKGSAKGSAYKADDVISCNLSRLNADEYRIISNNTIFLKSLLHVLKKSTMVSSDTVVFHCKSIIRVGDVNEYDICTLVKQQSFLESKMRTMVSCALYNLFAVDGCVVCLCDVNIYGGGKWQEYKAGFYREMGELLGGADSLLHLGNTKYYYFVRRLLSDNPRMIFV